MKSDFFNKFPTMVGFDDIFTLMDTLSNNAVTQGAIRNNWPPYNVLKVGDNSYRIELAVAGFNKTDIDVELDGSVLKVSGKVTEDKESPNYLHRGISSKAFERKFALSDSVEVKNATVVNGMLEILLENQVKTLDAVKKIMVK